MLITPPYRGPMGISMDHVVPVTIACLHSYHCHLCFQCPSSIMVSEVAHLRCPVSGGPSIAILRDPLWVYPWIIMPTTIVCSHSHHHCLSHSPPSHPCLLVHCSLSYTLQVAYLY